ncbi:FtsK/SpoIIIE domain-containing protein [Lactococcus sp. DD01]|uniref:FtsK/SpoIIIE domain-containing protein n=1 Tax=Lactococcus sp. DD01 TaxID=1776443 RepID=UPI000797D899|nr:FtsK/SpoIIIE domain-containing protein [Lactococcus sp. DD01]KXT62805.1 hypothetical protein LACDD01_00380 [Lactococcus sp. DD01]
MKIKKFVEWFTRLPPIWGFSSKLTIDMNQAQVSHQKHQIYLLVFKIWIALTFLIVIWCNIKNILPSTSKGKIIFDKLPLMVMLIVLILGTVVTSLWKFLHSRFSPIEKWKLELLLRNFTEEANILAQHDDSFNFTKSVKWIYSASKQKITIILKTGGHISFEMEKDIARRLLGFLIKETDDVWILEDNSIINGSIKMIFSHDDDERLIIDDLNKLKKSTVVNVKLTRQLSWDIKKQPQLGIFGKTASGKTSLIKTIIISFLANSNNNSNQLMLIDGKASFLSQSGELAKIPTATTAEECLKLLDDAIAIMNQRYVEMNSDLADESDVTYIEKFPDKGTILIACDELLALASATQASDKLKKPADRLMPQISDRILSLIVKSRQASIAILISGQAFPASLLGDSIVRSNLGMIVNLGRTTQVQSQELFSMNLKDLPQADSSNYEGIIWLDGLNWEIPKIFYSPYYDDKKLPFKATLLKLTEARGGGLPQDL